MQHDFEKHKTSLRNTRLLRETQNVLENHKICFQKCQTAFRIQVFFQKHITSLRITCLFCERHHIFSRNTIYVFRNTRLLSETWDFFRKHMTSFRNTTFFSTHTSRLSETPQIFYHNIILSRKQTKLK